MSGPACDRRGERGRRHPQHPRVIDEIVRRNWEIAANGIDMGHVHHGQLELETERELIRRVRETLPELIGQACRRMAFLEHPQSANTLMLLAESGFEYVADWAND